MGTTDNSRLPSSHPRHIKSNSADTDPLRIRTVDTEVTSRTAPAVIHEFIQPAVHEIIQKRITREVHKHHIYHRILPVLETEVLPSRHFLESSDGSGLIEASEDEVRKLTGLPVRDWTVLPRSSLTEVQYDEQHAPDVSKDRPQPGPRLLDINTEPLLMDKRTYVTEDGIFRTEYLWRHPPVFEDVHGRTVPVRIPAGISDDWRRIVKESKRESAQFEGRDRAGGVDVGPSDTRRTDDKIIGVSAQTAAGNGGKSQNQDVGSHVVPAEVEPRARPEHPGLAIRTKAGEGNIIHNGSGNPNFAKKDSFENLKGGEKATGALEEEENTKPQRETEEQARQQFLQSGSSTKTGLTAV